MAGWKNAVKNKIMGSIVEESLRQKIDSLYSAAEDETEERYGLHASAIIASEDKYCLREQVLSLFFRQNQGEQLPVSLRKIFRHGNTIHEEVYSVFRKSGVLVRNEETIFVPEYDLNYTVDAIVDLMGKRWICDVKSMNSFAFDKARSHPSGEKQVMFYEWLEKNKNGFVLAYNKNTSDIKIFQVKYDKEKVRPFVDRLHEIQSWKQTYLENGTLPPKKCSKEDCKRASTCNMRDACWKVGKGRVKLGKENGTRYNLEK